MTYHSYKFVSFHGGVEMKVECLNDKKDSERYLEIFFFFLHFSLRKNIILERTLKTLKLPVCRTILTDEDLNGMIVPFLKNLFLIIKTKK